MNLEEFEALTGVTVTSKYLEEEIAPEYIKANIDKSEFCEAWLKAEKKNGHIIKAHNTDFQNLVKENINLNYNNDKLKQDYERVCGECVNLREKNVALEENQKQLSEDISPLEKKKGNLF
jgi:predicted nuclease with TOPRIM domain